jgi:hypothetical protein
LGAPDSTGVGMEPTAQLPPLPQQTVGGMTFAIVPERLHGVELRGIGGEFLKMPPWVTLLERGDRRSLVDRAAIPPEDDMTPQMAQQGPHEARHVNGLEVVGLETDVEPHMLALGGHRQGRQGRDAVMLVAVGDAWCGARRGPGAPPRGEEENATFIQEGPVGSQAVGLFLSLATCSASSG